MSGPTPPGVRWEAKEGGQIAHLVFQGGKGNIFDQALIAEFGRALDETREARVKAVVLEGEGPHFSFGASVEDHLPARVNDFLRGFDDLFRRMMDHPAVFLAVVRGHCLGGGLEVASFCHRVFAAPDSDFSQPEIQLAVFAPIASVILPLRIGQPAADDLLLTGRRVDADEALRMGLVDELHEDPTQAALDWAALHFGRLSRSSLGFAARAARHLAYQQMRPALEAMESLYLEQLMDTPDAVEGITAFVEKRKPGFQA